LGSFDNGYSQFLEVFRVGKLNQISFYIITVKDSRNYDNLIKSVVQSFGVKPSISLGVTPRDLPCANSAPHIHEGNYRQLTCHEVAAALSHARARELALAEGSTWCFFLEDDSGLIQEDNADFLADLMTLPSEVPFFLHLFPEQNGILSNSKFHGMRPICKIPDYANGYALNRNGLTVLTKNANQSHLFLADWPRFPRCIMKLASNRSIFRHPLESIDTSLISEERFRIQASSRAFLPSYKLKQLVFKIIRTFFPKFGSEKIATEGLRSIIWR
jgi:GR25 family glycosyltransferase involved in LPS biosynthesis